MKKPEETKKNKKPNTMWLKTLGNEFSPLGVIV